MVLPEMRCWNASQGARKPQKDEDIMANDCDFTMRVVGRKRGPVKRMGDILGFEDKDFFLYRCYCYDGDKTAKKDGDFYVATYVGDVAWSPDPWLDTNTTCSKGKGSRLSNLQQICKALDIGVEIWAEEIGNGYQGHIAVDHNGCVCVNESLDGLLSKDEGDEDGPSMLKDGMEGYCEFASSETIYGDDNEQPEETGKGH